MEIDQLEKVAQKAASSVARNFDRSSGVLDDDRAAMVALLDPEEVFVEEGSEELISVSHPNFFFKVDVLQSISLRHNLNNEGAPEFDEYVEEVRDRFAENSVEEGAHMSVKRINVQKVMNSQRQVASVAESFILECRFLANLPKHPHIAQIYAIHADDYKASYLADGEASFFSIGDSIPETLIGRFEKWRRKQAYTAESYETKGTERRSAQISQRLEVILDVASALVFLADQQVVYRLHPSKVGFDSKYKRLKLFDFKHAQEAGKVPFVTHKVDNMHQRTYLAPEFLVQRSKSRSNSKSEVARISCRSDVYAFGMLLWETMTLAKPFAGLSRDEHMTDVIQGHKLPDLNRTWPSKIQTLLEDCWAYQPTERPRIQAVFSTLEKSLLEDVEEMRGIDSTENHRSTTLPSLIIKSSSTGSKSRKIKYQKDAGSRNDDRDTKSLRSGRSTKSAKSRSRKRRDGRKTKQSKENERSDGSSHQTDQGMHTAKEVSSPAPKVPKRSKSADDLEGEISRKDSSPLLSPSRNKSNLSRSPSLSPSRNKSNASRSPSLSPSRNKRYVSRSPSLSPSQNKRDVSRSPLCSPSRNKRNVSRSNSYRGDELEISNSSSKHHHKSSSKHNYSTVEGSKKSTATSGTRSRRVVRRQRSGTDLEAGDDDNDATVVSEGRLQSRKTSRHGHRRRRNGSPGHNDHSSFSHFNDSQKGVSHGLQRVSSDEVNGEMKASRRRNPERGLDRKNSNRRVRRNLERESQRSSHRRLGASRSTSRERLDIPEHSESDRSRSRRSTSARRNSAFDRSERSFDRSERSLTFDQSERSFSELSIGTDEFGFMDEVGEENDYPFGPPKRVMSAINEKVTFGAPTIPKHSSRRGGAAPAKRSLFRRHTGDNELFAVASAAKNNPVIPIRGVARSASLQASLPTWTAQPTLREDSEKGNERWASESKPIGLLRPAPNDTKQRRQRRPQEPQEPDRLESLQRAQYKRSLLLASGHQQANGKVRRNSRVS